jgi:hypothetical protein
VIHYLLFNQSDEGIEHNRRAESIVINPILIGEPGLRTISISCTLNPDLNILLNTARAPANNTSTDTKKPMGYPLAILSTIE